MDRVSENEGQFSDDKSSSELLTIIMKSIKKKQSTIKQSVINSTDSIEDMKCFVFEVKLNL